MRYAEPGERGELNRKYAKQCSASRRRFRTIPRLRRFPPIPHAALAMGLLARCRRTAKEHTPQALKLLEGALATHSDHIAAIHFYIHLVEASDRPQRAEPYADRLRGAVPGAGHLVHMPAHIYLRAGPVQGRARCQ